MNAASTAIGVMFLIILTISPIAFEYVMMKRLMKAAAAERFARMAREDAAWEKWLRSASKALADGRPVPPWRSP
jgi:hypothetical protein